MSAARVIVLFIVVVLAVWYSGSMEHQASYWRGLAVGVAVVTAENLMIKVEKWARWKWGK